MLMMMLRHLLQSLCNAFALNLGAEYNRPGAMLLVIVAVVSVGS